MRAAVIDFDPFSEATFDDALPIPRRLRDAAPAHLGSRR
jgi:hypothetical protein